VRVLTAATPIPKSQADSELRIQRHRASFVVAINFDP
jgi:hypothetical protein